MYHLDDSQFEEKFANCTLNPDFFTHEGHIRLAWIHLKKYGREKAIENLCTQIAQYDRKFGDGTKFHRTLTVAAMYVVDHYRLQSDASAFQEFIVECPRLKSGFRELISAHYSEARLADPRARDEYIAPDLIPF